MMQHLLKAGVLAAALFVTGNAIAGGVLKVENAWVRATVPGQAVAGAFMDVTSSVSGRLVKVESPVAATVQIHSMAMKNGVMEMRELPEGLELTANKKIALAPGGYHIMLMDLKKQLKAGDTVPLTLTVEAADKTKSTTQINAPVKSPMEGMSQHH
jgi:copper(I)-binding protein